MVRRPEDMRHQIDFPNRTSPDNHAFICNVWEAILDDSLEGDTVKRDWKISTIEVDGKVIPVVKIREGELLSSTQFLYQEKSMTGMDEEGNIYYFDKNTSKYVFDSKVEDFTKYKKIFETLKAKEE